MRHAKSPASAVTEEVYTHIISTDEDPGLRIESFAVINLRGVSTNKTIIYTESSLGPKQVTRSIGHTAHA